MKCRRDIFYLFPSSSLPPLQCQVSKSVSKYEKPGIGEHESDTCNIKANREMASGDVED